MKYKISIIIPIFNVEDYLRNALNSILHQTMELSCIQVIMVDDASTDNSKKIIDEYCEKYDNFYAVYLKNNSGSAGYPRNIGLKYVQSDYVMFLDPDDEYESDYCEVMYDIITENNLNLVKSNSKTIMGSKEYKNYYFNKDIDKKIITSKDEPLKYVAIWNGIHKYEFIVKNDIYFPTEIFGEDIFFTIKEFLCIDKFLYLNNYFGYRYFNRESSHAKSPSVENVCNIIKVFYITNDLCKEYEREEVSNFVLGTQITGVYLRIINVEKFKERTRLLKQLYKFVKINPNLVVPSPIYKISQFLLSKKLIYI